MYRTVVALALAKNVFGFQMTWHPKAAATDGADEPQWKAKQGGGGWEPELKEDGSAAAKSGHWDAGKWVKSKAGGSQGFHDANGKWHQAGSTPGHHDADGNWVAASDGEDSLNEVEDMSSGDGANGFGGKTKEEYQSEHDVCIGACCQMGHEKLDKVPEVAIKLIMTDGCSGSTAVMEIVEQLHQAANLSYAECHAKREVFDDINAGNYNIKHLSGKKRNLATRYRLRYVRSVGESHHLIWRSSFCQGAERLLAQRRQVETLCQTAWQGGNLHAS